MVVDFLQSLVPATPGDIGASLLHSLYTYIHRIHDDVPPSTKLFYFSAMDLSDRIQMCLQWWINTLTSGLCRQVKPSDMATIGITWGGGSGSGTGGTFNTLSFPSTPTDNVLDIWMGTCHSSVTPHSLNWR